MYKPFPLDPMALMQAIVAEIRKQNPKAEFDVSLSNKISFAVNDIAGDAQRERVYATKPMTPSEWLGCDDVGLSSTYMITVIADLGVYPEIGPTPVDSADLGRCIRMVECCGLENSISKMSECGEAWTSIVDNWQQLKQWHEEENHEEIYKFLN